MHATYGIPLCTAVPLRSFEVAFKMYDLNGDGHLDPSEFASVFTVLLKKSRFGQQQKSLQQKGLQAPFHESARTSLVFHIFFGKVRNLFVSLVLMRGCKQM